MRATTKLLHIVIWLALTVAGFNVRAAKEPLYDGLGSYSRKVTTNSAEIAQTQTKFEKVWAKADLTITTSCLCQPQA